MNKIITIAAVICFMLTGCSDSADSAGSPSSSEGGAGKAGSMARFALVENFLYTLDNGEMSIINVDKADNPAIFNRIWMQWGIETLFPYGDNLFVGAEAGMYIYDVSEPSSPEYLSEFSHVRSCDPVVVSGNTAYVTLRSRSDRCWGTANELEILDVTSLKYPTLIDQYEMYNPHGLAVDDTLLFICDGEAGIKAFNVKDPEKIVLKQHIGDVYAYDAILTDTTLIAVTEDGLYQYDRRQFPMTLLSKIAIAGKSE